MTNVLLVIGVLFAIALSSISLAIALSSISLVCSYGMGRLVLAVVERDHVGRRTEKEEGDG